MNSMVFVNFPVADVNRSVAFYEKLGFKKNEEFSTEEAGSMVWDDTFWVMLLSHDFYKKFIYKKTGKDLSKDIDFLLNMYCRGSVDMTVDWVLNDMPIKKEEIVQYLMDAIPDKLEAYMI